MEKPHLAHSPLCAVTAEADGEGAAATPVVPTQLLHWAAQELLV